MQLASLAEPSAWSGSQTHSSQQTLLQSGRQLFEPGSNKKTLPPLTQTAAAGQLLSNNRTGTHSPHNQTQGKIFNTQSTYSQVCVQILIGQSCNSAAIVTASIPPRLGSTAVCH